MRRDKPRDRDIDEIGRLLEPKELETEFRTLIRENKDEIFDEEVDTDAAYINMMRIHRLVLDELENREEDFIQEYDELKVRLKESIENQEEIIDEKEEDIDELIEQYGKLYDIYRHQLLEHSDDLEELSQNRRKGGIYRVLGGGGLIGAGYFSAENYSRAMNALEFYANSPWIYAEDPEFAVLTLGFPAAGAYLIKKGYDHVLSGGEAKEKAREIRKK